MFPSFFFFLLSAIFCLSFSSLPLLFDILKPKKVPTRWGLWHIYIYPFMTDLLPTFLAFFGRRGSKKSENLTGWLFWGFGFFLFISCNLFLLVPFFFFLVLGLGFRGRIFLFLGPGFFLFLPCFFLFISSYRFWV